MTLVSVARRFFHVILPAQCACCSAALSDDPVPFFCRSCWGGIEPLRGPSCPRCGRPFASSYALQHSPDHVCGACRSDPPAYTRAWSLYPYASPLQEAVHLFKYNKKVSLADALGALMNRATIDPVHIDVIIPVPLHPTRLRNREYNQSLLLADGVSRARHIPLSYDNLIRIRETAPQTDLSRAVRLKNLRRAFVVRRPQDMSGKHVLIIDDVFTTGTTVNECAKTLRKAGASEVYVCTLARTL
ncbi:MAG TPA: ComF family protein [Nitrospiraceae bacterium]|nr:ComF family protein [Nitrospiraceae bacterium]